MVKDKPPDFNLRARYALLHFQISQPLGFQEEVDLNMESRGH